MTVAELRELLERADDAGHGDERVRFEDGNGVLIGDAIAEAYSYAPNLGESRVYVLAVEIAEGGES